MRPGWFDYNDEDQLAITFLQGDTRHAGTPADGVISRRQIAQVLVDSLASERADHMTFELVAERGPAPDDLTSLFAALVPDDRRGIDGVRDQANMSARSEPDGVLADLTWADSLRGLPGAPS